MTNANATATANRTSSFNYYCFYIGLVTAVVFVASCDVSTSSSSTGSSSSVVSAETVSISNAKNNDGWSANNNSGGLRRASIVTDVIKAGMFQEDNGFEGTIRYISDEIKLEPTTTTTIVDTSSSSSSSSSSEEEEEEEQCYVSFQKEDLHADDHCDYERKVITASEADHYSHTHILIANEECNYDLHTGYWYQAECDGDSIESITFNIVKSFCGAGCKNCYDNDDLPNILGTPSGQVFHSWDEKVTAVCPVPTSTTSSSSSNSNSNRRKIEDKEKEEEEELFVQFSGNCLAATCQ